MKRLTILGSTGSVGRNALDIVSRHMNWFKVAGLTAGSNVALLEKQIKTFSPEVVALADEVAARELKKRLGKKHSSSLHILSGLKGVIEVAAYNDSDFVLSAIVGSVGLAPTLSAIRAGKTIGLANKESLVMAGEMVIEESKKHGVSILPVDSEHSAIFQCIEGHKKSDLRRIILTASGGPFADKAMHELHHITPDDALKHPRWKMGKKISIDSATLMNKGLEVVEAHYLFDLPAHKIDVLIHPQSIVHSMVEFLDRSCIAQLSIPDMKGPIAAMLVATKALISEGVSLGGTLSFSFVPDEENDGTAGTKFLLEQKGLDADYCIVGEPSGKMTLFNGHRGCLWLEIETSGRAAHGSAPWTGINAFEKMVQVVNQIERKIKPKLHAGKGSRDKPGTITVGGKVITGEVPNTVPQTCTMTIDRRLAPGESIEAVKSGFSEILTALAKEDAEFKAEMRVLSGYDPCITPLTSELVRTVSNALGSISGESPQVSLMMAGCDMRYFHQKGIPTVVFGPGELSMAHQSDENVAIEELMMGAKVYALSAIRLLGC